MNYIADQGASRDFRRSARAMGILYLGAACASFLVGVMLARLLGAAQYGVYALAMTGATLVGVITEAGLPNLAMRETGRARAAGDWSPLNGLLRWADFAILAGSFIAAALVWGVLFVRDHGSWHDAAGSGAAILWAVALVPLAALGKMRALVLLALDAPYAGQVPQMILRPLLFVAGCLAWYRMTGALGAAGAMAIQAASALLASGTSMVLLWRYRPRAMSDAQSHFTPRSWLVACLPMGASEGLRMLQGQIGLLLVGWLAGTAAAGRYRVADAVMQVAMLASSAVATAATPMFARLWAQGDRDGVERIALLSAWTMLGGTLLLGAPVALLGKLLFPVIFGHDFAAAQPMFLLLWAGGVVAGAGGLAIAIANMTGHHMLTTQSMLLVAGANALLGGLLIPRLGASGGALATALSMTAGTAWCSWRLWRETGINASVFDRRAWGLIAKVRP